jgi:3-oxoacyl-[acyl-carrier-protein] synthase II
VTKIVVTGYGVKAPKSNNIRQYRNKRDFAEKELFNHNVPYTSIKSMIGNPYGAVGILQVISFLLSINDGFIPPTIRTNKEGFEEMNIVTETMFQNVNEVVITNHGYGGNNACAYIKSYK